METARRRDNTVSLWISRITVVPPGYFYAALDSLSARVTKKDGACEGVVHQALSHTLLAWNLI